MAQSFVFEWDHAKSAANLEKQGISFEEANLIFEGSVLSRQDDRRNYGEVRTVSVGCIRGIAVVAVVHTDLQASRRIISARLANRRERKLYHEHSG